MEGGVEGVEPCGLELEVHGFDNSKGIGMGLKEAVAHSGMNIIIDREFHEIDFQEQLQEINDELARFDNNVVRSEKNGLGPPKNPMHWRIMDMSLHPTVEQQGV
nr:hypothetical protein CFP56_60419 [Quercus suber]